MPSSTDSQRARLADAAVAHAAQFGDCPTVVAFKERAEEVARMLEQAVASGEPLTDDALFRALTGGPLPHPTQVMI